MRRRASGSFELPIPASAGIGFFTPEGERRWVPGWDPAYPSGEPSETPGTVFITEHGDTETFWVIEKIDREAHTSAYSRTTPGRHAGAVRVRCEDRPAGHCLVSVEYDMTALTPGHADELDEINDEHFEAMMKVWATRVAASLTPDSRD